MMEKTGELKVGLSRCVECGAACEVIRGEESIPLCKQCEVQFNAAPSTIGVKEAAEKFIIKAGT